ncbi:MAG: TRAP transporter fused permease subunit [Chloroflexi bacterium]|nr:TRAP transporter fused permease subunit [Chloroflexota bacterium]
MEALQYRHKGPVSIIISILSITLMAWAVVAVMDVPGYISSLTPVEVSGYTIIPAIRPFFFPGQHLALFLFFALLLTFLLAPARKGMVRPAWYDYVLIVFSAASMLYLFFFWGRVEYELYNEATLAEIALAGAAIVAILEATRRTVGPTVSILVILFILYPLVSDKMPGLLMGKGYSIGRVTQEFYLGITGIFGVPLQTIARIAAMFILFGEFFSMTGAGKTFIDGAFALFGHVRGGPAKVAVVSSGLFGTISGSPVANVLATGTFTIPMMKKVGYPPVFAGAVEAASSTGGSLMPPVMGVVAFIMAGFLGVPYLEIAIAAALPAVLYYFAIFLQVDFRAARIGLMGISRESLPSLKQTALKGWLHLLPPVILVFLLAVWRISAERAAVYSIVFLIALSLLRKDTRLDIRKIAVCFDKAGRGMLMLAAVTAAVGMITASVYLTGLAGNISPLLMTLSAGNLLVMLLWTTLLAFIMGMGTGAVAIYIILATLVAPAIVAAGVSPMAAHLFIFYFGMLSFLTPPVCVAAYVAAAIAGADPMKTGWQSTRLAAVAYIMPFFFVYSPAIILRGNLAEIAMAVPSSLLGCLGLAAGLEGYLFRKIGPVARGLLFAGGVLLIFPGLITDLIGLALVGGLGLFHWRRSRVLGLES